MEDVLIPVIVFSSLLLFMKMMLDFARFRHEHKAGTRSGSETASNSLRVSELESLVQDAVDDAVRPLERRLRRLERAARRDESGYGDHVNPRDELQAPASQGDASGRLLSERTESEIEVDLELDEEFRRDDRRVRQPRVRRS